MHSLPHFLLVKGSQRGHKCFGFKHSSVCYNSGLLKLIFVGLANVSVSYDKQLNAETWNTRHWIAQTIQQAVSKPTV